MPFLEVNSIRYHYERFGHGTPVLLITGLAGNWMFWAKTLQMFPEGYDVIAVDNRGSGETVYEGGFTIDDMADDAACLIRELGLGKTHVLGWSMGSHIAMSLTARYPELVRSLTLVSSYLRRPSRSAYILRAMGEGFRDGSVSEETVGTVFNVLLRTEGFFRSAEQSGRPIRTARFDSKEGMIRQLEAVEGFDLQDTAHRIKVPVLSVHGSEDIMTPPACGDELADEIGGCERIRIPSEGHVIRPETYIPGFIRFMERN